MVKMIPQIISPEVQSNAEKRLFNLFSKSQLNDTVIILHSLGIAEHSNNIFGEVDFVIICSEGILCVEVKGGAVERNDGYWTYINRYGKHARKQQSPFSQAQGNMHSLRSHLIKRLGNQNPIVRSQFASCVIMPDCNFEYEGIDIITEVLFDHSYQWTLSDIIKQSFRYWRELCNKQHGFIGGKLTDKEVIQTAELLRGDFRFVPSLKELVDRASQELCALTDEQYEILEALGDNERTLVSGMAGTGKTLLAAEQCRRAYWTGKRVLYVCFNQNISKYVKSLFTHDSVDVDVSTLHALMMDACGEEWSPDRGAQYFHSELPDRFLAKTEHSKYELVVIDEGQDLLNRTYLKCLDIFIQDGLAGGNWSAFYDPNQNLFNPQSEMEAVLPQLRKVAFKYTLTVNCRNTKQIANANTLMTNIPQVSRIKASGPNVEYIGYSSLSEEISLVIKQLEAIKGGGVNSNEIVLLSVYTADNPNCCLAHGEIPSVYGKIKLDFLWQAKKNDLRFATISSFKGLEAKIVVLMDVDSFADEQRRLLNYVAISRASAALYVFYDKSTEEERQEMLAAGYPKLVQ